MFCGVWWCAGFSRFNDYFSRKGVVAHAKFSSFRKVGPLEFDLLSLDWLGRAINSNLNFDEHRTCV